MKTTSVYIYIYTWFAAKTGNNVKPNQVPSLQRLQGEVARNVSADLAEPVLTDASSQYYDAREKRMDTDPHSYTLKIQYVPTDFPSTEDAQVIQTPRKRATRCSGA